MNAITDALAGATIGDPQTFRNLAIFPLFGKAEPATYFLLDDALERDLAEVKEISAGGSVPTLAFENKSDTPILLVEGDELRGAKQNRILNLSVFVPARAQIDIPVSCVEAGRWRHTSEKFASGSAGAGGLGYGKLRASNNRFVSDSLAASNSAHGNQGGVWNSVDEKLQSTHTVSGTRSMSDAYEKTAGDVAKYVAAIPPLSNQRGAVVFIDGKPAGLELFDNPETFARFMKKLVRSYALDAIETAPGQAVWPETPTRDEAVRFLLATSNAERNRFDTIGEGQAVRWSAEKVAGGARVVGDKAIHIASFATA